MNDFLETAVMLNFFQHPRAVIRHMDTVNLAANRAWILKQVQDDEA